MSEAVWRLQVAIGNLGDSQGAVCRVGDVRAVLAIALEVEDYGEPAELELAREKCELARSDDNLASYADIEVLQASLAALQAQYDALCEIFGVAA